MVKNLREEAIVAVAGMICMSAAFSVLVFTTNRTERAILAERKNKLDKSLEKYLDKKEQMKKESEVLEKLRNDIKMEKMEYENLVRDLSKGDNGSLVSALYRINLDIRDVRSEIRAMEFNNHISVSNLVRVEDSDSDRRI